MRNRVIVRASAAAILLLVLGFFSGCEGLLGDLVGTDSSTTVAPDETEVEDDRTDDEFEDEPEPEGLVEELIHAVNSYREDNSLAPLQWHDVLATAAQNHTDYMVSIEGLTYNSQYTHGIFLSDLGPIYGVASTGAAGETGHGFTDGYALFDLMIVHMSDHFSDPDMTHHAAATAYGQRQIGGGHTVTGNFVTLIMIKGSQEPDVE